MPDCYDFERDWLERFSGLLGTYCGEDLRAAIMPGSERLTQHSDRRDVIRWSRRAVELLETRTDRSTLHDILTGCACRYPRERLQEAREAYEATGDVECARAVLQRQFESSLKRDLALDDEQVAYVLDRGWGLAGVLRGDKIIATKIPKSGFLAAYLEESDPETRRQMYCHCPRIRDAIRLNERLPATYCYCGAGFYRAIWEEILQHPVRVEVLDSVLQGGDVCVVMVHLSEA
jgi:hypothetical protein